MNEDKSRKAKALSKAAFDAQAKTYDKGMEGDHARQLYRIVADKVTQARSNIHMPHILDPGCGTGALAEIIQSEIPIAPSQASTCHRAWLNKRAPVSTNASRSQPVMPSICPFLIPRSTSYIATTRSTTIQTPL